MSGTPIADGLRADAEKLRAQGERGLHSMGPMTPMPSEFGAAEVKEAYADIIEKVEAALAEALANAVPGMCETCRRGHPDIATPWQDEEEWVYCDESQFWRNPRWYCAEWQASQSAESASEESEG